MQEIHLEKQELTEPLDDDTLAAIELGVQAAERGEIVTLEQSNINLEKRLKAWRKAQKKNLAA